MPRSMLVGVPRSMKAAGFGVLLSLAHEATLTSGPNSPLYTMASYDNNEANAATPTDGAGLSWRQLQQLDSLALSATSSSAASAVTALSSSAPNLTGATHPLLFHRPHPAAGDDDARSVGSRLSNAGSTYSAATFYSFSTSNYSGFAGAGELARRHGGADGRHKRHYVHPQDLDPNAMYDVDWVQDDAANACMACFAEFSALLRRKHHCRACGRVVCSTCLRHRLSVTGLRGLQKACDDCALGAKRGGAGDGQEGDGVGVVGLGLGASGSGNMMRGACESISEDTEPTPRHSPATTLLAPTNNPKAPHGERKVEGEKQNEEAAGAEAADAKKGLLLASSSSSSLLVGPASAAELHHHRRRRSSQQHTPLEPPREEDEEPFPIAKKERRSTSTTLGYLAMAAGTAVAVGSVLAMRNPQLVASLVAQVKAGVARR